VVVAATPGPREASDLGLSVARLFREVNRRVTYALERLEGINRHEFTKNYKLLILNGKYPVIGSISIFF
jgi:hypothetical protein